jgi:exonuclease VII large subunit
LVLSIVMMFSMFFIERQQKQLLDEVDSAALEQIDATFLFTDATTQIEHMDASKAVSYVGKRLLASTRSAIKEQTQIWRQTIDSAERAWVQQNVEASRHNLEQLTEALRSALGDLRRGLDESIQNADESMQKRWGQWQTILSDNSRGLDRLQEHNQQQVKMLADAIEKLTRMAEKQNALPLDEGLAEIVSAVRLLKDEIADLRQNPAKDVGNFELKIAEPRRRAA